MRAPPTPADSPELRRARGCNHPRRATTAPETLGLGSRVIPSPIRANTRSCGGATLTQRSAPARTQGLEQTHPRLPTNLTNAPQLHQLRPSRWASLQHTSSSSGNEPTRPLTCPADPLPGTATASTSPTRTGPPPPPPPTTPPSPTAAGSRPARWAPRSHTSSPRPRARSPRATPRAPPPARGATLTRSPGRGGASRSRCTARPSCGASRRLWASAPACASRPAPRPPTRA